MWSEEIQGLVRKNKDAFKKWLRIRSDYKVREYEEAKSDLKKASCNCKGGTVRSFMRSLTPPIEG